MSTELSILDSPVFSLAPKSAGNVDNANMLTVTVKDQKQGNSKGCIWENKW